MKTKVTLFWFRRDLRLNDNRGLFEALNQHNNVLPIFIFDPHILEHLPKNDARVSFIYSKLEHIHTTLKTTNSSGLATYYEDPKTQFELLLKAYDVEAVYTNHDYEPYALKRDNEVSKLLESHSIAFKSFKDQVIFEKNEVVKDDGLPYKVYTPYSKKWLSKFTIGDTKPYLSETVLTNTIQLPSTSWVSLKAMGFETSTLQIEAYSISSPLIETYESTRNIPSVAGTSRLGPHLRFGTISVRTCVSSNITFLKELIWREFFMQILWHFPHTVTDSFKPQYDNIKWRNHPKEFEAWCKGQTGYPLVDAGMRELNQTGFMHNRVRMLVGSFLCKHLLIDWRWGEAYFAQKLHDYELSSNVSNWQWVAGCGVDAAPYFRIFNPTTQIKKFDTNHDYIRKWVPEYQELHYPTPIVDHKLARERCLATYKTALGK
jgi:deoxyribodipyrimidine photo-lyase